MITRKHIEDIFNQYLAPMTNSHTQAAKAALLALIDEPKLEDKLTNLSMKKVEENLGE